MGKNYGLTVRVLLALSLLFCGDFAVNNLVAQTFNDGPINLQARVRRVRVNHSDNDNLAFINLAAEFRMRIWAQDNADLDGQAWVPTLGVMLQQNSMGFPNTTNDFNQILMNNNYGGGTVPQFFDIRFDAWEDDCPSDVVSGSNCGTVTTAFDGGCCNGIGGCGFFLCVNNDDDERCNSNPFQTQMNYRLGPPCQWYNHGYVSNPGTCPGNRYEPEIESFWRYTRGNGCGNAIILGNVAPGFTPYSHFNSNECYSNVWTPSAGNDVTYQINVTQPTGLEISLCSGPAFANNRIYLLDAGCNQIAFNQGACGATSEINYAACAPGTYYIVVDAANLVNVGTFTLSVTENPSILVRAEAGPNVAICEGNNTPIGAVIPLTTATNGTPPYSYSWNPNYNISATNVANPVVAPLVTTTYYVDVTDATGCTSTDSVVVTVNPGTPMTLGPDVSFCPGNTVTVGVNPNVFLQHFWSNGASGPSASSIPVTQPGTFHVTVVDFNGCLSRDTINVNYFPNPNLDLGPDTSICQGASLLLDATIPNGLSYGWTPSFIGPVRNVTFGGTYTVAATDANCTWRDTIVVGLDTLPIPNLGPNYLICPGTPTTLDPGPGYPGYLWSNGTNNQTLTVNTPGIYSVTVTNTNGCSGSDDITIGSFPQPTVNLGPNRNLCVGASTTLNAGPGFVSYQWFPSGSTQSITVSSPGTYMVTVTDANGCEDMDTIVVNQVIPAAFDLGNDTTLCPGTSISYTAPSGFSSYLWSTGAATPTASINTPGTVRITVTDPGGCSIVDSIQVIAAPAATPNLGPDIDLCPGSTTNLNAGPGFLNYAWSNGGSGQIVTVGSPGPYRVTVTNGFGCIGRDTILVNGLTGAVVNLGPDQNLCDGNSATLNAGNGFANYVWSNGANTSTISVGVGGQYSVTVTNSAGCSDRDTINLTLNPSPVVDLGNDTTLCFGGNIVLDAGNPGSTYSWSTGASSQTLNVTLASTYFVTVTNSFNCSTLDNIVVGISPPINVNLGADTTICDSSILLMDAGAGMLVYQWSGPNGFSSPDQIVLISDQGTYTVTVTDPFGCTGTDDRVITVSSLIPDTFLGSDTLGCDGVPILLDAGSQFLYYTWQDGSQDQYYLAGQTGTYTVIAEDPQGCRFTDDVLVTMETPPNLVVQSPGYICPNTTEVLDAGNQFSSYLWSTGETTPTITISQAGTYSVTVTYNACVLSTDLIVSDDCSGRLFIPNVFTPNNDLVNDEFTLVGVQIETFHIWIYDRWGKFIFESNNINSSWSGRTSSGKDVPEGVYYYRTTYKFTDSDVLEEKTGNVTVLR